MTTAQDERGRQRRLYEDAFGRTSKVEETFYGGPVYSTTAYSYNARDQLTQINQAGQTRTFEYDGHGRLWRRTTPEQGTDEFSYNRDDTLAWAKDARGAKTAFGYNSRHLTTSVAYDLSGASSGQNVQATPNLSFQYDAAGNRTQMTDGLGSVTYHYDGLGRMDWEDRTFTGLGTFRLSYGYNVSGQLQSVKNHWNAEVTYVYDRAGRVRDVNGSGYAGVSNYASSLAYRAFGAPKAMSFPNGRALSASYDNRMRPTQWKVPNVLGFNYSYDHFNERTGRVTYAQNIHSGGGADPSLDRSFEYDHVGRLVVAHSGAEARAHAFSGQWGTMDGPFSSKYPKANHSTWVTYLTTY
ncbi:MAG TPA: hypothetical protein VER08_03565 [Pyrinomonadaceae bacterium]|nr:hypothetical protein [Pyrinomonadaceae bacterium]